MRLSTRLIAAILSVAFSANVVADCAACKKIRKSEVLGIKLAKEYLLKSQETVLFRNAGKAKRSGYAAYQGCADQRTRNRQIPCSPAIGIAATSQYLCPTQLKPFASVEKAASKGFVSFTACGQQTPIPTITPTVAATATPVATPKPLDRVFSAEAGTRFSDVDGLTVIALPGGGFRSYSSASESTFERDTLRYADSADGLAFGSTTAITGIAPETDGTFANPGAFVLANGSIGLLYEDSKHISSGGLDIHRLRRGLSLLGDSFVNEPSNLAFPDGSSLSSRFDPSVVRINASVIRLYYSTASDLRMIESSDEGLNWGAPTVVSVAGRSDQFAPFLGEPSVVRTNEGSYLMFFASGVNIDTLKNSIFAAESSDGTSFFMFDQPLISASDTTSYQDPHAIVLQDGRIRLYVVQRSGESPTVVRNVKSWLSN